MRIIILLALLLVPAGVSAEVTTVTQNDLVVTWYPVQEGITHFAYNISVQNLQDTGRGIDLSTLFSDTSFDISQLANVKFHEWENVSSTISVPIYENQSYNYTYIDNATGKELTETRWRMVRTGTAAEMMYTMQWKPAKMQSFEKTASVYKERMGVMNVPKYESKVKDGTGNGTKWFRLEFDAPIQKLANGWGSVGKVAFEIDGYEYHPEWYTPWNKRRPILFSGTTEANYTMNLTFDSTGSDFMDNGSDVRIVSSESGSEVDLDRVNTTNFNTSTTIIWFMFNESGNVNSSNINSTYYLYYGNPSAGAALDNGSNVYLFYDDFNRTDSLTIGNNWVKRDNGGVIEVKDNELKGTGSGEGTGPIALTNDIGVNNNIIIEAKRKIDRGGTGGGRISLAVRGGIEYDWIWDSFGYGSTVSDTYLKIYDSDTTDLNALKNSTSISSCPENSWCYHKLGFLSPEIIRTKTWNFSESEPDWQITYDATSSSGTLLRLQCEIYTSDYCYFDDIAIRKYISPEPTTSLGDEEYNIHLSNPQFSPADGKMGSNFVFIVNVSTGLDNVSTTLRVFDPSQVEIFNSTVNMTNTTELLDGSAQASISMQLNETGTYSYYWHANSTEVPNERSNATGILSGPIVYSENHNETFEVPWGATKILAGAYWYGTAENSLITLSLRDPDNITHTEFSIPTIVKNFKTAIIDLPLISYNVTVYSGYKELVYSDTNVNGTWTFTLAYTNVTKVETEIGWS